MLAGVDGKRVKLKVRARLLPQAFAAVTLRVPLVKLAGTERVMLFPLFAAMVQLAGTVQLYEVAPVTAATE